MNDSVARASLSRIHSRVLALIGGLVLLLTAGSATAQLTVYDDALQNGFDGPNYSFGGGFDFNSTTFVHAGTKSISIVGQNFNALSFAHVPGGVPASLSTATTPILRFWVNGGAASGQQFHISLQNGGAPVGTSAALANYIAGGGIAANVWRQATVDLTQPPFNAVNFDRIDIQSDAGAVAAPAVYFDDLVLGPLAPAAVSILQIDHDVAVAGMTSDRFTWKDSLNRTRSAALAQMIAPASPAGPGGSRGGAMREYSFQLSTGATRTATVTTYGNAGYSGFGYIVSHSRNRPCAGDDSPLGFPFGGTWERIFEGRHHAIFRFHQNYPRNCPGSGPLVTRYLPVTIDWLFSTGHDNPLWAVTYDVDQISDGVNPPVAADTYFDDSRAPYGELNIDGDGSTNLNGVAWGERYRFTTTNAAGTDATRDSPFNFTATNTVPFVKEWLDGPLNAGKLDATIGIVQTQSIAQQDAGGARDLNVGSDITSYWHKTQADNVHSAGAFTLPDGDNWSYQAMGNNFFSAAGSNNARMTWKTQYGFIGQTAYTLNNGAVEASAATAPGYPKKSYSTYVVLGQHTSIPEPVDDQVTQVEIITTPGNLTLSINGAIGSIVTSGPAGITRAANVTYSPAGYNHVYGALAFNAAGNALDANIAVGAGTLKKPLIIVSNYTAGDPIVKLGGVTLVADADYFASLRPAANELWMTLNRNLAGGANHLEILQNGVAPGPAPVVASVSPLTGSTAGGTAVTITGANFVNGATVNFGGIAATNVVVAAAGSITATTPAHAAGAVSVDVTNPDLQTGTQASAFTYQTPPGQPVTIHVDVNLNRQSISPFIYGVALGSQAQLADLNATINRDGGNPASRYNWSVNAANRGMDFFFESIGEPTGSGAGARGDDFITSSTAGGAQTTLTIPMIDWVAKLGAGRASLASFSKAKYGPQKTCGDPFFPDACDGIVFGSNPDQFIVNDPNDANTPNSVALQQGWVQHLLDTHGTAANGGLKYYTLENEPSIWFSSHRDAQPVGPTMKDIGDRLVSFASMIKSLDPGAQTLAPEEWGYDGYFLSGADQQYTKAHNFDGVYPDRINNGGALYYPYLLQRMKSASDAAGKRLFDVLTVHYYPQSGEFEGNPETATLQLLRNRSTRSLWDPAYIDESYIKDEADNKVMLIPRLKQWVATYYPGTDIGITEYNWGAENLINGATTQADIMGIIGREGGVRFAIRWTAPPTNSFVSNAFKMYRNYDGAKSAFGETSVSTTTSANADFLSAFGAVRCADGAVTLMVVNKDLASAPLSIDVASFAAGASAQVWQLSGTNVIQQKASVAIAQNALSTTVPAQSITLFVIPPVAPPAPPTISAGGPTTFCAGGSVTLTSSSATGNQWYLNNVAIGGATNPTYNANASGNYTVQVTTPGCGSPFSAATSVTVNPIPPTPMISTATPTTFCAGGSVTLTSSSGSGNQWYLNGGIINGAVNPMYNATASGNYSVKVTTSGCTSAASAATSVTVNPIPTLSPATLPDGVNGTPYSQTLTGSGGAATYTFAVTSGALPTGLTLSSGGLLNGTPTATASFTFTVAVSSAGCSSGRSYTVQITAPGAGCAGVRGDANNSGAVETGDIFFLINNLFTGGPAPVNCQGDANHNGSVETGDIFYLINYLFTGGPAPANAAASSR